MDRVKVSILQMGLVRIETGKVSGTNHLSADELLNATSEMLGGPEVITRKDKPEELLVETFLEV